MHIFDMKQAEVHNVGELPPAEKHDSAGAPPTEIVVSCTPEYKEYSYNEKHNIWALVTLKGPCQEEDDDDKRAPIDIVAVIDKSGSMAGNKLDLVKKTLEFILTQLTEKDRLSVVTYDTNVYVDFGLKYMTKSNKDDSLKKIQNIKDGSSTNLCGGLMKGLCQMLDRKEKNEVASVLLFTDGLANHSITNSAGIVAAMKSPRRFDGPTSSGGNRPQQQQQQQPHNTWLGNIFGRGNVPSTQKAEEPTNLDEPKSESTSDYTVYTFGFGSDHDPDMLKKISDAGNGMYYFIENEDKIAESFGHCLGGLMSTVAQGIQLNIVLDEDATVKDVHTMKPFEKVSDKIVKVNMGDLQSEEQRDVVLEITIDALPVPYNDTKKSVLSANVDYFNVITNTLAAAKGQLGVLRPEQAAVVHDDDTVARNVVQQRARIDMTRAIKLASHEAEQGNFQAAQSMLNDRISFNKKAREMSKTAAEEELYDDMMDDLNECYDVSASATEFNERGRKLHMNMEQQYGAQRSSNVDSGAFVTKGKMKKRAMAKSFAKK